MSDFPFKPRVVGWELTLRCNMNCLHCGSSAGSARPNELSEAEGLSFIDDLADLGTEVLTLSGGEPLLHSSWEAYARRLVGHGIRTYMITNGLLLERNIARLLDAGVLRIGLSLDGVKATHDFIRRHPGSYDKAIAAATAGVKAGLAVGAVTHVSKANFGELEDMYRLFSEVPLSYWQIQITFKQGRMKEHDDYSLDPSQLPLVAAFIHEKQGEAGGLRVVPGDNLGYYCDPPIREKPWKGCFAGRHLMGLDADGAVKGCLSLPREFVEGNIRERSLREIWEDPDCFRYNRYFEESDLVGHCEGCDKARQCRAGCVVTAHAATGSRFDNPYCIHRVLHRDDNERSSA